MSPASTSTGRPANDARRLRRIFDLTAGNMDGAQRVSTLHDMRFVFFDDDTRILRLMMDLLKVWRVLSRPASGPPGPNVPGCLSLSHS